MFSIFHVLMSQRSLSVALKRKRELSDDGPEIPSHVMVGVVTNAIQWIFVKLDEAGRVYQQSVGYPMGFLKGADRLQEVSVLFTTLHKAFLDQCHAVDAFCKKARLDNILETVDEAVAAAGAKVDLRDDDPPAAQL